MIALFPGQGSQQVGMGKAFYDEFDKGREIFEQADQALGFSLSEICFDGPAETLTLTANVQPAILTVSTIAYELAAAHSNLTSGVVAAAGHSLGEYSALVAAGALSFSDAVVLVHKRGKYMQEAVPAGDGAMVAVLGKEVAELEDTLNGIDGEVAEIANVNAPGQIVISGSKAGMEKAKELLEGTRCIDLPVSAPFHCSLMQPAAEKLAADLDQVEIQSAKFPVYANVLAAPISNPEAIRQALKDQVCGRVRWTESIQKMLADTGTASVTEFGTGNVLTGLMKRIDKSIERKNVGTPEDLK